MRRDIQTTPEARDERAMRHDARVEALLTRTSTEIDEWVESNVTTIAGVRAALKIVFRVLILLLRRVR
jgi:hypothetical protein